MELEDKGLEKEEKKEERICYEQLEREKLESERELILKKMEMEQDNEKRKFELEEKLEMERLQLGKMKLEQKRIRRPMMQQPTTEGRVMVIMLSNYQNWS